MTKIQIKKIQNERANLRKATGNQFGLALCGKSDCPKANAAVARDFDLYISLPAYAR